MNFTYNCRPIRTWPFRPWSVKIFLLILKSPTPKIKLKKVQNTSSYTSTFKLWVNEFKRPTTIILGLSFLCSVLRTEPEVPETGRELRNSPRKCLNTYLLSRIRSLESRPGRVPLEQCVSLNAELDTYAIGLRGQQNDSHTHSTA